MATFFDLTGLEAFSKVFIFILVVISIYAILHFSKFGRISWLPWLVALVMGLFVIMSDLATGLIKALIPWGAVLFLFLVFSMTASQMFGAAPADWAQFKWVLYIIVILILFISTMFYFRENTVVPGDIDEDQDELKEASYFTSGNFFLHPNFLALMFILLVGIFTVALLAGKSI
ncbi:hypothetical protein GOV09_04460 [Candidatus Woesearchaeota archaeon]|nr:hypothetical protein [Candidatus Woesearchaeota archaeon]